MPCTAAIMLAALPGAIKLYQDVRTLDPTNVEARTYVAWLLVLSSRSNAVQGTPMR